ncbi:MAG: hypothetical protein OK474_06450 [Thaumarchaeota archaeon]|nr:hypothetical protein [Nitrososphaerota archaeon]
MIKRFALPALLVLLVLASVAAVAVFGAHNAGGAGPQALFTTTLTPGQPQSTTLAGLPVVEIAYTDQINTSVTAVVYAAFHNSAGQVVYMTTAVLSLNEAVPENAVLVIFGLPTGEYQVTIFAVSSEGTVISPQSTISVVE